MRRFPLVVASCAVAWLALAVGPLTAAGARTARGYVVRDYATGFPYSPTNDWGPIGLAFDSTGDLYVVDAADNNLYRFPPGGGAASSATQVNSSPIPGALTGLAFTSGGELYLARYSPGDIVQLDPSTGAIMRVVANVPCATGLAVDPRGGNLYVSENQCGSTIFKITHFASGPGKVTPYATARGVDGLSFGSGGALFAESDGRLFKISSTGHRTGLPTIMHADGVAVTVPSHGPPNLYVNRNDGIVSRITLGRKKHTRLRMFSGGSRGDFAILDSTNCLYFTQTDSVLVLAPAGQVCSDLPSKG